MLVGIVAVVLAVLNVHGGFMESMAQLSQLQPAGGSEMAGPFTSFFGPDPVSLFGVVILTSLGTWGLPQMIHKFYTVKNEKTIKTGTIISTVFALIIAGGSYFMGGFGRLFVEGDTPAGGFDSVVPTMLQSLPDLLIAVVIILVLSASMSTLSSLVITSSSTFTIDFLKGIFFPKMNNKRQMLVIRLLCAGFIAVSVLIALNPNSMISSLMSISWGALAGAFLGPFLYGLFWKRTTRAGVWAGFISGIVITVAGLILNMTGTILPAPFALLNSPLNVGALAIVFSLIIVPLVSVLTPKLPKQHVEASFACYDETIAAHHKYVLEEVEEEYIDGND